MLGVPSERQEYRGGERLNDAADRAIAPLRGNLSHRVLIGDDLAQLALERQIGDVARHLIGKQQRLALRIAGVTKGDGASSTTFW